MPLLSIIIVNYKSERLIVAALASVYKYNKGSLFEVIIVSNSDDDESSKALLKMHDGIQWINMGYNAGFARANNSGMKAAKGEIFLLLNPDTIAVDNSIEKCFSQLSKSSFLAAGVQLQDEFGRPQISGNFFVKGGLNHLLPIPYWGSLIRWLGYQTKSKIPNVQQAKTVEEVDWITGAFLMVKKAAVEKAGLMDEDFFLYAEEVEWCSRLKKVGALCIFGDLKIIHLEGASINKEQNAPEKGYYNLFDKKGLQLMVSNHLRVRKQYGVGWFSFLLLNYSFGILLFWIVGTLHSLFTFSNPILLWQKGTSFTKNVFQLWRLSPRIINNKPHFYKMF